MKKSFACLSLLFLCPVLIFAGSGDPLAQLKQSWTEDAKQLAPDEIIQRFAAKESEFRDVWRQYTYTQNIVFQELSRIGSVKSERRMQVEVYFTSNGQRQTRILQDHGRLVGVQVTQDDIDDAIELQPFVLTREDLPKYNVEYHGRERVDELDTYVFDLTPRKISQHNRLFQGRVWVDDVDYQIVMTRGRVVPDYGNNRFPEFETVREQIDGQYWFPTWTEADEVLHFKGRGRSSSVRIRQLITFENFQKFEVETSISFPDQDPDPR